MSRECDATILIADDNRDVVDLLRTYVRPLGCEVISARDGEEALLMAQEQMPDVVLLDVLMPKKSGWEVCQALKAVQRTAGISIILVTGRGEVKDRLTGLQLGADDYLVKPFQREEVTKRIGAILDRRALRRQAPAPEEDAASATARGLLHDPATSLPTVGFVMQRLKEILIEQGQLGMIFVDIEQVEAIEADYGWAFFDEFLKKVAEVVTAEVHQHIEKGIVTIGRIAGSNFYIFLETKARQLGSENLELLAETLRDRLTPSLRQRFPAVQADQIGFFSGSGIIHYEPQIRLERQIYQGMQTAVDTVRNAEEEQKRRLFRELRDIIKRKRVTTLFQPIVRAVDSSVFGYEVLTRGPADSPFRNSDMLFGFARVTKLAWDLEALALDTALRTLRSIDLGDRKFLLNFEAEMFSETDLKFHDMVAFFSRKRGNFVFELTERAAIEDYGKFRQLLEEFREKGIEIAIASLAPDYLKVTKGLVTTLAREPIKQDLMRMLVDLAHRIGAQTIAEGIETEEEYDWCRKLGIDLLQGYYIARPQPEVSEVVELAGEG
jgi:EAL domain-containing protein (putative c-di-GMP-specific phosphodiesterase class I)/DNA-binding response OmpR family regulator